jgi:calcineurin-like phosphoesterase family protein
MAEIWFSSDLHLGHANIIKFCDRPFADTWEMNEALIANHNLLVKPQDHWYNLGDVTMERGSKIGPLLSLIKRFNGHGRLIGGNHDHYPVEVYLEVFEKVMAMQMFDGIRFTHIPIHPRSMGTAVANVHGHTHNAPAYEPVISIRKTDQKVIYQPYVNISCEMTNYRPITLGEVKEMIAKAKGEYDGMKVGEEVTKSPKEIQTNG